MRIEYENIEVGSSIQLQFQRSQLPLENIFKEFIDNSLQSFLDPLNNEILKKIGVHKCSVKITINEDSIVVLDNAFGMNHEAFKRSLRLNQKSDNYAPNSLGEFGMGLKYAAISLGNEYTIESTAYGSKERFKATINSDLLQSNSKTVKNEIDDNVDIDTHYTQLTIRKLLNEITNEHLRKLIYDLSRIYHIFIENGELEIIFTPNRVVKYTPPEIWIDKDGSELMNDFDGRFIFKDKEYEYYGWIGILRTAKTSDAGFSLLQKNRIIMLNYRHEKLLGKPNSFPFQRLVGDINLDKLPVDFNKNSFTWKNGMEEAFIESLKNNNVFAKYLKLAKELRKTDRSLVPDKEVVKEMTKIQEQSFSNLSTVVKTPPVKILPNNEDLPAHTSFVKETQPLKFKYEGIEYTFQITYSDEEDASKKWLVVEKMNEENHEYLIQINNNFGIFSKLKKSELLVIQNFATVIALSEISSIRSGFKDSHKFVNKLNEIIKTLEG